VDAGLGVDISVQALTKYPSGGGDVLMGSVITRDEALHLKLKLSHMRLGTGVGANDAETVLRSLPSIALRYRAQDQAARELARLVRKGSPNLSRCCIRHCPDRRATRTGSACAAPKPQTLPRVWLLACSA
jgi:cystathionine beta-lyase/cystathionine gamma-synthase